MPDDIIESWFETLFKKPVSIDMTAEEVFDEHGWL
jgi:hypothetical protein